MMKRKGNFLVNKDVVKWELYTDSHAVRLWIYLLSQAEEQAVEVNVNGRWVLLAAGDVLFNRTIAAREMGMSRNTVADRLAKLEAAGSVSIRKLAGAGCYVVSLCNWASRSPLRQVISEGV